MRPFFLPTFPPQTLRPGGDSHTFSCRSGSPRPDPQKGAAAGHRHTRGGAQILLYSLACVNMSKIAFRYRNSGEYRGRTDDLLHAMQAL